MNMTNTISITLNWNWKLKT